MKNFFISVKKWLLLGLLLLAFALFYYLDGYQYLTFNTIKTYQVTAEQWTLLHYKTTVSVYLVTFIVLVACGVPCGTIFTLLGGFLFGMVAIIYALLGTIMGGVILFLAIRTSIGNHIAKKRSGWIKKMEHGFQLNAFNYLLMLRLVPIFPCGLSNVAAGALNVPLKTFVSATLLGIFPATLIYVMIGRGLDKFLSAQTPNLDIMLTPSIFLPLLGLAILSILPVIYRSIVKKSSDLEHNPLAKKTQDQGPKEGSQ